MGAHDEWVVKSALSRFGFASTPTNGPWSLEFMEDTQVDLRNHTYLQRNVVLDGLLRSAIWIYKPPV